MMSHGNIQEKKQGEKKRDISHVDGCERFDIKNDEV
jgi:hypothetical protein